ncbi:uncharacterized protein SCDLUD_003804 [Saccharomycodes ludwigii]|uniref:uncharacterized protein n=1 Tax=Saccharomycodes ludwigii TaxID=36035 RepID=UPI001E8C1075|nr:hypothetical protein SCDLUD_003804 [Saccharomycodes ludwigii]KAH3899527.1 hypothetical protein SCDLUD_003804 [Saccharomycodes ludwigii]
MNEKSTTANKNEQNESPAHSNNSANKLLQNGVNSTSSTTPASAEETFSQQTTEPSANNTRFVVESPFGSNSPDTININIPAHLVEAVKTLIRNDAARNISNNYTTNQLMESKTILPMGVPKNKLPLPPKPPIRDFVTLAAKTDYLEPNELTCSVWGSLNSHNATNYIIPWDNFPSLYYEFARFDSDTWKKFISRLTPMPYPVSSLSEIVNFIRWYNKFTYVTHQNGIHQLLFYTIFSNIKKPSPIEEAENKELVTTILPKIFPHRLRNTLSNSCSSTVFRDQIEEVFPAGPLVIATKLLNQYIITNTTTVADIEDQLNIIQSLRYCARMDAMPDNEIIPHLRVKISDCYGESTAHLIRKWINTPNLTLKELLTDLHEYMQINKRYGLSTNTKNSVSSMNLHITHTDRYHKTPYPKHRHNNRYPNRNKYWARNNSPTLRHHMNHQSRFQAPRKNSTNHSNINDVYQNNADFIERRSRIADFQPFFPDASNINRRP